MYSYFDSSLFLSCAVSIVVGIFLVVLAMNLFSNSSPFSQSFGQYFFFGFVKWDDFAGILLVGAFMAGWGIWTLVTSTTHAIQYQAAHESVLRTARIKAEEERLAGINGKKSAHHALASNHRPTAHKKTKTKTAKTVSTHAQSQSF